MRLLAQAPHPRLEYESGYWIANRRLLLAYDHPTNRDGGNHSGLPANAPRWDAGHIFCIAPVSISP
jgi:hypothetical protein